METETISTFHGEVAPSMADLRSRDVRLQNQAWETAWPILWSCALGRLRHAWQRGLWDKLDLESCAAEAIRSLSAEVAGQQQGAADLLTFRQLINATTRRAWQRSVDLWRKQGRPTPLAHREEFVPDLEAPPVPVAVMHDLVAVLEVIRAWPNPRRDIFLLTYIEGMGSREVAETLDLTDANVRTHLFRGREDLWQHFPGIFEARASNPQPSRAVPHTLREALPATT